MRPLMPIEFPTGSSWSLRDLLAAFVGAAAVAVQDLGQ